MPVLQAEAFLSETCWAHKKWNKIASDIKLVFYSSTITMMHGPINIRYTKTCWKGYVNKYNNLMFIGPCIIAIVDEWKTILMSLAIIFHLLCAQHVSDINISIFRSLRLLMNYHIGRLVLSSLFVGVVVAAGIWWNTTKKLPAPKAPTHNELRTRRPMW